MGVFDKFLDAIKLNDDFDDDDFLDDDILDDDFDEIEEKPRKKFFDKFSKKRDDEFEDGRFSGRRAYSEDCEEGLQDGGGLQGGGETGETYFQTGAL